MKSSDAISSSEFITADEDCDDASVGGENAKPLAWIGKRSVNKEAKIGTRMTKSTTDLRLRLQVFQDRTVYDRRDSATSPSDQLEFD